MALQRTFILHSVSHSAAMGLISPREYVDLVRFEKNFDGGKYCSFGEGHLLGLRPMEFSKQFGVVVAISNRHQVLFSMGW